MCHELEGNSKDFCNFNYETACSENYDVIDFSSFHIQDGPLPILNRNEIPVKEHLKNFKSEGDSPSISEETEGFNPFFQNNSLEEFSGCLNMDATIGGNATGNIFWNAPGSFIAPPIPSYEQTELKIRYTRKYLLNCRRSPQSRTFPDSLLKYAVMKELPLKQKKEEVNQDYRSMDHILFYNTLPHSRKKHALANFFNRNLSV